MILFLLGLLSCIGAQTLISELPENEVPRKLGYESKVCWKDTYDRGVGIIPSFCPAGFEKNGLLCYPNCKTGFYGVGPVCWEHCKSSETDWGIGCSNKLKTTYTRGAGSPMVCGGSHPDTTAGLCYKPCPEGFFGNGPVCWQYCKGKKSYSQGALCCDNNLTCYQFVGGITKSALWATTWATAATLLSLLGMTAITATIVPMAGIGIAKDAVDAMSTLSVSICGK